MRYTCNICHHFAASTTEEVLRHVYAVHSAEPGFSLQCGINGCSRSFTVFKSFRQHVRRRHNDFADAGDSGDADHAEEEEELANEEERGLSMDIDEEIENVDSGISAEPEPEEPRADRLKRNAALFLLKTKEVNRVSQKALDEIVGDVTDLLDFRLSQLKKDLLMKLDPDEVNSITPTIDEIAQPFKGLESSHLQEKYFKEELDMLEPVERRLGQSLHWRKVKGKKRLKLDWDCAYDIPLLSSLRVLLSKDEILQEVLEGHTRTDGFLCDYCDGDAFKEHPLFSTDPTALQIMLFYDDMEVVNPLGSYTKTHKLSTFYYTLANISPEHRSSLIMIQLLAIVKAVDVAAYGMDMMLKPFMEDLAKLEREEGVDFDIKGATYNFRGTLALVSADNLASQAIGGYKALNSALRKCRHCMAVAQDISTKFLASEFEPRTRQTHDSHMMLLTSSYADDIATTYGLTRDSILNSSRFFHVTDGLPPDCMHDILEGCLQYEVKELLRSLVDRKFITIAALNQRIEHFPYAQCDSATKPSPNISLSTSDHSLKQNASQMWCLARLLPLMIGEKVPEEDPNWENFLLLLKITDMVFSPMCTRGTAVYLADLIDEYLHTFRELYPDCPTTPKQHYMIHIPQWILKCGPLTRYWCMRFEAKNSHFKQLGHRINNFKNICKSLTKRHQAWSCYKFAGPNSVLKKTVTGPVKSVSVADYAFSSQLLSVFTDLKDETIIQSTSWISIGGTTYKPGNIVVVDSRGLLPIFGEIEQIMFIHNEWQFVCQLLDTQSYKSHYHAYEVSRHSSHTPIIICNQSSFVDYHVLALYNNAFVPLKYHIPEYN